MSRPLAEADLLRRAVAVDGVFNFRDVGGYPTDDGGTTRWGRLFRSDALHTLTPAARATLDRLGLRTVIDLRTDSERDGHPSAFGELGAPIVICPILESTEFSPMPTTLIEIYNYFVDARGTAITSVVRTLAGVGAVPAVVHCTAGKDRTGVVTAMLLSSLGVPDEIVASDFAATELFMTDAFVAVLAGVQGSQGVEAGSPMLAASAEMMTELLARIRTGWGGALGFLRAHGLEPEEHERLRRELVEHGGE
jgi:protein-tyrosine phosphatase